MPCTNISFDAYFNALFEIVQNFSNYLMPGLFPVSCLCYLYIVYAVNEAIGTADNINEDYSLVLNLQ